MNNEPSLSQELLHHTDAIVQRWYEAWQRSPRRHPDLSEAAIKDHLPAQLRLIGEQIRELSGAEDPTTIWSAPERLDQEARVKQDVPIEAVVQEYRVAVDTVREWIEERRIDVDFQEYSYFYAAMFELAAEAVRRYASRQAERIRKDRAHYLARVMHQIRTPLSTLSTQVELLEHAEGGPGPTSVSRLRRNVQRIRVLAEGILRLERFEPWEVPVEPEAVRPAQLVDEVVSDHEVAAARKGLRLEAHVERSLRMTVDPGLFLDALDNLVHNAVQYTKEGFVIVDAEERGDETVFHVRDSGPGLAPERLRGLFEQAQPGSSGGAGIGLKIAQHAARAQDGRIEVESEVGKGSVFSLRLPCVVTAREPDDAGRE